MERIWTKSYPPGVPADLDFTPRALPELFDETVRDFPNNIALDFQGVTMTYRQLDDAVDKMASVLTQLGVQKGTRVGTVTPNTPQMVIMYYATLRLGGIMVCNNPLYTERELEHQINDAGIEVLLALDLMYDKISAIRPELPNLKHVIVTSVFDVFHGLKAFLGPKLKKDLWKPIPATEPVKRWKELMRSAPGGSKRAAIDPDDLALLQYTGGTTGVSKGVMLSHANLSANARQAELVFSDMQRGNEVVMAALPLFHSYGQTMAMNVAMYLGAKLVLVPNPRDLGGLLATINRTKPTLFPGVPTLYANLLQHPDLAKTDMSSIRICGSGAAPLPLEVQEQWEKVTGGRLVEGYGLSETSPLTHINPPYGKRKIGTIGLPVPGTDCKLVDVEDPSKEIDIPGPGELCIRGPQVMRGYWNRDDETAEVLRDGWLHTGDVCEVDEEGFFKIVDRKKDMILVGGFNVYPRDIEEILYQHPAILEAAAVGLPDKRSGEIVKAYIVLKPGQTTTAEDVEKFCRERLTAYKVPKLYEFREDLPKTMIGKILRRALIEEEKAKAEAK
ncbi:MAG TPA: long-chain fatty acid--CoA ligase [Actinomycetota bacterium]|nr:long-chain fatty acid--CoA ligase [Actinomycetota bacterium]